MRMHAIVIQIHYKFHEILTIGLWLNLFILNQYKDNISYTADAILIKLDLHLRIMFIHTNLNQIPLIGILAIAPDRRDGRSDKHGENYIPPSPAWNNKL